MLKLKTLDSMEMDTVLNGQSKQKREDFMLIKNSLKFLQIFPKLQKSSLKLEL